ncbi:hypothetical protein [Sphingomonas glacialis]|uniref:DUF2029 domain-containing protein n=1 Tax=Sphingomonas glacialis TaxID=658225 RepID=A0A502FXA1_9SPHN|nr:hypothetical protein [Sphingomonas glacialis]TPG54051.1 hypothetical protein EAH76_04930 [Sphingomonas glacialis]
MLLLPLSVLADGALFWPAACFATILAASARHYGAMLVWYGLALGFDGDALILGPFVMAVAIGARMRWQMLPLVPVFALAMLVARSRGLPLSLDLQPLAMADEAPSLWAIVRTLPWINTLPLAGLALTSAFGAAVAFVAWGSTRPLRQAALLDTALFCALMLPVLLPAAEPQALLLAGGLAWLVAVLDPRAPRWRIAALVTTGALTAWLGGATAAPFAAIALVAATLLHARIVLKPAANDNPAMARAIHRGPLPLQRETC